MFSRAPRYTANEWQDCWVYGLLTAEFARPLALLRALYWEEGRQGGSSAWVQPGTFRLWEA
jgi:hypothetical protein